MSYQPKSYRKFLASSVTAAAVVATSVAVTPVAVVEAKFSDVGPNTYYSDAVEHLVEKGVLNGYPDGTFKPNKQVTRAEAAKMIVETLGLQPTNSNLSFTDVNQAAWYAPYVATLVKEGVINGYPDGTFKPNGTISRAEMAKMLVLAFEELEEGVISTFVDVPANAWYAPYIGALVEKEVTTGTTATTFSPDQKVTRAQAATFLYRIDTIGEDKKDKEKKPSTGTGGGGGGGGDGDGDVKTPEDLFQEELDSNKEEVTLKQSLTGNFEVTKLKSINFGGHIITGNLDIKSTEEKEVELKNGTLKGNLTVDAPNATITNNLNVTGTITIQDIDRNSWIQNTTADNIVIEDSNKARLEINNKVQGKITYKPGTTNGENAELTLDGNTSVDNMVVDGSGTLEVNTKVEAMEILAGDVELKGKSSIEMLKVKGNGVINANTTINKMVVSVNDAKIKVSDNGNVSNIEFNENINITSVSVGGPNANKLKEMIEKNYPNIKVEELEEDDKNGDSTSPDTIKVDVEGNTLVLKFSTPDSLGIDLTSIDTITLTSGDRITATTVDATTVDVLKANVIRAEFAIDIGEIDITKIRIKLKVRDEEFVFIRKEENIWELVKNDNN